MLYKLQTQIGFGKHNGKTIEWIVLNNPNYIEWCIDNVYDFYVTRGVEDMLEEQLNYPDYDLEDNSWRNGYSSYAFGERD